jgi:hypothetical protein
VKKTKISFLGYTLERSPGILKKKPARPCPPKKPLKLITPIQFESLVTVHEETSISESEREMDALVASLGLEKKKIEPVTSIYSVTPPPFLTDRTPLLSQSSSINIDPSFFDCSRLSDNESPIPLSDFKECRPLDTPPPQMDESLC